MFSSRHPAAQDAWEGVVIDKSRNMPDGSNLYHYVNVQFGDGKTKRIRVDADLWASLAAGDRLVKEVGQDPVRA
jgi:hypothetical protein